MPPCLLLVEDSDTQAVLFEAVFEDLETGVVFFRVPDVDEALSFLSHSGSYETAPKPDLVLLDLHLPRRSGYELLAAVRANPSLKDLPVVIFSADSQRDRDKSLSLGASEHLGKPLTLEGYQKVLQQVVGMIRG